MNFLINFLTQASNHAPGQEEQQRWYWIYPQQEIMEEDESAG